MSTVLDIATLTSKGQITLPARVRRAVGLHKGDRVLFIQEDDGRISLHSPELSTLSEARQVFVPLAAEEGIESIDDVVNLVKEVRANPAR